MGWTNPRTWVTGEVVTAAQMNAHVRDNLLFLNGPPSAKVKATAVQSIPNDTVTTISWDAEDWDNDTIHDNVTNNSRLTAKTAGKYRVYFNSDWVVNAANRRTIIIKKNGTTELVRDDRVSPAEGQASIYVEEQMAVNDYVEAQAYHNTGGALNFKKDDRGRFGMTWFSS